VQRVDEERKSTYALTEAGYAELDARRAELSHLEEGIAESVRERAAQVREDVRGSMRGLRADLAAAAQQARASAVPHQAGMAPDDPRLASHVRYMDAEAMIGRFRDEIRADLRRADAGGKVEQLTLDTLRTVLDSALTAVRATLR
jgi:hypothetical protein